MSHIVSTSKDKFVVATAKDNKIIHAVGKSRGITGPAGPDSCLTGVTAGETIIAYQAVYVENDVAFLASNDDIPNFLNFAGIAKVGALVSQAIDISTSGTIENPGWSFTVPGNIYLGLNGQLTQTPVSQINGNVHRFIGEVISPTRIIIRIEDAVVFNL